MTTFDSDLARELCMVVVVVCRGTDVTTSPSMSTDAVSETPYFRVARRRFFAMEGL